MSQPTLRCENTAYISECMSVWQPDLGTPPLLEGSEALLLEFWRGSEEWTSKFFGGLEGGEFPSLYEIFHSTPIH